MDHGTRVFQRDKLIQMNSHYLSYNQYLVTLATCLLNHIVDLDYMLFAAFQYNIVGTNNVVCEVQRDIKH